MLRLLEEKIATPLGPLWVICDEQFRLRAVEWEEYSERMVQLHRPIGQYPVLARAGAIVPLTGPDELGVGNPASFEVHVFTGADGEFTLYEDDDAAVPRVVRTRLAWNDDEGEFTIGAAEGELDVVPSAREWTVVLHGVGSAEVDTGEVTAVEQGLRGREGGFGAGGVVGVERLDDFLDGGAQHGALGRVARIAHNGLLGALLGGLDIGHSGIPGEYLREFRG